MPKLGCIIRPETRAYHASLATEAKPLLPAWTRIPGTPRIEGYNSTIGDCACVAAVMAVQTALARKGDFAPLPNELPVHIYSAVTGYNPADPSTDRGTDPLALFEWWKQNPIANYRLKSATPINPANINAVKNAIVNGGAYLCVELATEQENQSEWKPVGTPGSWGGHAIWADTYEADWLRITSWGEGITVDDTYLTGGFAAAVYALELGAA